MSAIWIGNRIRVPRPQTKQSSEASAEEVPDADGTTVVVSPSKEGSDEGAPKKESEGDEKPAEERQSTSGGGQAHKGDFKPEFEFTPNAPAWTPGGVATDVVEEKISPVTVPADDKTGGPTSATASSKKIPQGGGGDVGGSSVVDEPELSAGDLNP